MAQFGGWPPPRSRGPRSPSWPRSPGRSSPASISQTVWYAVYGFRSRRHAGDHRQPVAVDSPARPSAAARHRSWPPGWCSWSPGSCSTCPGCCAADTSPRGRSAGRSGRRRVAGVVLGGSYWLGLPVHLVPIVGCVLCLAWSLDLESRLREGSRLRAGAVTRSLVGVAPIATGISAVGDVHSAHAAFVRDRTRGTRGRRCCFGSPATRSSCTAGGRTSSLARGWLPVPVPVEPADAHARPGPGRACEALLEGPDAPTWFVASAPTELLGRIRGTGAGLQAPRQRYTSARDDACGRPGLPSSRASPAPPLDVDCDRHWLPTVETGPPSS